MSYPLQTGQDCVQEQPQSFVEKFQKRLAESRYLMLSCVIHAVIVIVAGSVVWYQAVVEPKEFIAGGDGIVPSIEEPNQPLEMPREKMLAAAPKTQAPNVSTPVIDVIHHTAPPTIFKMPTAMPHILISTVPEEIQSRTPVAKDALSTRLGDLPPSLSGRIGAKRDEMMRKTGGSPRSEKAVVKGLNWLRQTQNEDGSWGDSNKAAMTGLALLCFLGHGETPQSPDYGLTLNKAVGWIIDNGTKNDGRLNMAKAFNQPGVYEHGICTYALGEYYTMTRDPRVLALLKQAVGYIVEGQGPGGGWMYSYDKTANDLSVSGWQIQALKAAHLSELNLPGVDKALDGTIAYLENVKGKKGGYGYRGPDDRYSLTGVGILSRLFWKGERGDLQKGMNWMLDETGQNKPVKYMGESSDLYAWYYHTQACLMFGGGAWTKWRDWFQDELCDAQSTDGSWPKPGGKPHGPSGQDTKTGKVYRTTLCILMLEVFYRYMPTTQG